MHPLDGPRAKVERAKSQLEVLHNTFQRFFEQHPYRVVVAEFDAKVGHYNIRVQSGPPAFPDEWGVVIGEIAHNLRSALNELTWQLALLQTPNPYDRTDFPIYTVGHTKQLMPHSKSLIPHFWGKGDGLRLLRSVINAQLRTWIEAFQPYKRKNGGRLSPLFLLEELNNTDKHRLITVVTVVAGGIQLTGYWGGGGKLRVGVPLHPNAKVGEVAPLPAEGVRVLDVVNDRLQIEDGKILTRLEHDVHVDTTITPSIRFGASCGAVKSLPVVSTLQGMANEVSGIIESFAREF